MISFFILTDTPGRLATALIARGILKRIDDPRTGKKVLVGVRSGTEWEEIPNPILVTPAGPIDFTGFPSTPEVRDSRRAYMVKLAHEANNNDDLGGVVADDDPSPKFTKSKFAKWVRDNGDKETLSDGKRAWRLSPCIWLIDPRDAAVLGRWQ